MKIYEKIEISSAHHLENYKGKCENIHGHNYILEIWVEGDLINDMVIDFSKLKKQIKKLDHVYLNNLMIKNPTAENMITYVIELIKEIRQDINIKVRIWEDKDSYAEGYYNGIKN